MHRSTPVRRLSHRVNDIRIAGAAAEIAAHPLSNFCGRKVIQSEWPRHIFRGSARPTCFRLFNHRDGRHNLAGRTEPALKAVVLDKGFLHSIEASIVLETFDGTDAPTVVHYRECHAGQNAASFNQDSTRSAFTAIARFLWAGQAQYIT